MNIDVQIVGLDELRVKLDKMRDATQDLKPGLLRSGLVALKAARTRILDSGPGWPPNKTHTPLLRGKTGLLRASLTASAQCSVMEVSSDTVIPGTSVRYARWLQEGTGIYGPRGEPIRRRSRLNATLGASGFKREVRGGIPPRPYLFIDEKVAEAIRDTFAKYVMGEELPNA